MTKDKQSKLAGVVIATIAVVLGAMLFQVGYRQGVRDESGRMATELVRRHLAYWRVDHGKATLEYRYVPQVHKTCVKYGGAE